MDIGKWMIIAGLLLPVAGLLTVVGVDDALLPPDVMLVGWAWFWPALSVLMGYLLLVAFVARSKREKIGIDTVLTIGLLAVGIWQGALGLMQVYGWAAARHSLYALTGSFFNPGPYSGFLAVLSPLAVDVCFRDGGRQVGWLQRLLKGLAVILLLLLVCVLPAGRSRAAWVAAGLSAMWVCWLHLPGWLGARGHWQEACRRWWKGAFAVLVLVVGLGLWGSFFLNRDSANGRMLIWKVCLQSMQPCRSLHSEGKTFGGAYGEMQEAYFASGRGTPAEELVAGSPEYAFNEFIQLGVEYGWIPMGIGLLAVFGFGYVAGCKARDYGALGMWVALVTFACFSYPLHFPAFWALMVLTGVKVMFRVQANVKGLEWGRRVICALGCMVSVSVWTVQEPQRQVLLKGYHQWDECRLLYRVGAYEDAAGAYRRCMDAGRGSMKCEPRFLFEWGRACFKAGRYREAIRVLKEAGKVTADPMVLNLLGQCYAACLNIDEDTVKAQNCRSASSKFEKETLQKQKKYNFALAEQCYKRSVNRLPARIYPYYLLAKLYAHPQWRQPEKMRRMAETVLTKKPKIDSPAIKEMRQDMKRLLEDEIEPECKNDKTK